jgi:hypothetical protein
VALGRPPGRSVTRAAAGTGIPRLQELSFLTVAMIEAAAGAASSRSAGR